MREASADSIPATSRERKAASAVVGGAATAAGGGVEGGGGGGGCGVAAAGQSCKAHRSDPAVLLPLPAGGWPLEDVAV